MSILEKLREIWDFHNNRLSPIDDEETNRIDNDFALLIEQLFKNPDANQEFAGIC